jgi:hypothetical protein
MKGDIHNRRSRVLMMEGANFTAGFVSSLANAIVGCGKYEVDGLGFAEPLGIPFERRREDVYREMSYYPAPPRAPKNLTQAINTASSLFSFSDVPDPVAGDPHGLRGYVYRRVFWHDLRSFLRNRTRGYDLYHWHCFTPEYLPALDALLPKAKLILTLWGSDVYRTYGVAEYARQLRAARRASLVTMATPELADAFLSKFGRELESKVRLVSYGSKLVDVIDRFRPERDTFLRGIGIDSAKISIVVGHNASPSNQHEAVLREIAKLQEALRSQIAIVIPMTYTGTSSSYVDSIRVLSEQLQLPVRILDQRLSLDDVARLRVATDILIHVPISDQFSAAMCESLVGGAVLITGGWLPYRRLRASGVQYHEVFEVGAIAKKLGDLLDRFQFERSQVQKNVAIVRNMMSWQSLVPQWTKVYDELLNSGTSNSSRVPGA